MKARDESRGVAGAVVATPATVSLADITDIFCHVTVATDLLK